MQVPGGENAGPRRNIPKQAYWERWRASYFLFQKVDMAANTMASAASESEQLVTAGLQICLQFDRVGVRGVEVCTRTVISTCFSQCDALNSR